MSLRTVADDTAHAGRPRDVPGPDRLGGLDVLLHDGPEDGGLAFVEHRPSSLHSMIPSANGRLGRSRCGSSGADRHRGSAPDAWPRSASRVPSGGPMGLHDAVTLGDLVLGALRRFPRPGRLPPGRPGAHLRSRRPTCSGAAPRCSASAACSPATASACCRPTGPRSTSARSHRSSPAGATPRSTRSARSTTTCYACDEAELRFLFVDPQFAERAGELLEKSATPSRRSSPSGPSDVGEDLDQLAEAVGTSDARPRARTGPTTWPGSSTPAAPPACPRRRCSPTGPSRRWP